MRPTVASPPLPPEKATAVVYSADGAGGFAETTEALRDGVRATGASLRVEMVDWSHGHLRMVADHLHISNLHQQARRLADSVREWHKRYPHLPVYFIGHSAGCMVVLEAAETLGPGYVERIVLLAPSVSADYDLRPALASARLGVDSFMSNRDWFVLGVGMTLFGTTDRHFAAAAGRVGFRRRGTTPADVALYSTKLRQHRWDPSQAWTGHDGGHYGSFEDQYLRTYILPLFGGGRVDGRNG
jgi:alpha-beta hydrolase superfamily lysophospholipase